MVCRTRRLYCWTSDISGQSEGLSCGELPWFRINPERKELVEFRMK